MSLGFLLSLKVIYLPDLRCATDGWRQTHCTDCKTYEVKDSIHYWALGGLCRLPLGSAAQSHVLHQFFQLHCHFREPSGVTALLAGLPIMFGVGSTGHGPAFFS